MTDSIRRAPLPPEILSPEAVVKGSELLWNTAVTTEAQAQALSRLVGTISALRSEIDAIERYLLSDPPLPNVSGDVSGILGRAAMMIFCEGAHRG